MKTKGRGRKPKKKRGPSNNPWILLLKKLGQENPNMSLQDRIALAKTIYKK